MRMRPVTPVIVCGGLVLIVTMKVVVEVPFGLTLMVSMPGVPLMTRALLPALTGSGRNWALLYGGVMSMSALAVLLPPLPVWPRSSTAMLTTSAAQASAG